MQTYNIPDELIIDIGQTSSKYVLTSSGTMAEKDSKHGPKQGANDEHSVTLILAVTFHGEIIPMIYTGTTSCSLPAANFPEDFSN